jgi:hypothetical protein
MPLTCNIDARGRLLRAMIGLALLVIGLVLVFALPPSRWLRAVEVLLTAAGVFCLFQAQAGWCALRAMGIRTRV